MKCKESIVRVRDMVGTVQHWVVQEGCCDSVTTEQRLEESVAVSQQQDPMAKERRMEPWGRKQQQVVLWLESWRQGPGQWQKRGQNLIQATSGGSQRPW